jgi:RecJ-like exonuclease
MATCIICGAEVDGAVCRTHEEDVWFEFRGNSPSQLTPDRYYRGDVDGFADFGVFVNVGDDVTGLLHRSELPTRPENLDWNDGDAVFVQVKGVRENGNIDLCWSIRQSDREFRGALIDDPDEGTRERDEDDAETTPTRIGSDEPHTTATNGGAAAATVRDAKSDQDEQRQQERAAERAQQGEPTHRPVEALTDHVGERVRLEGEIASVRQTSGPTIFEVGDETGVVECAAFVEAGVRAYPEVEVGDVVRLDGEVERRRGDLQVETEALTALDDDERADVEDRLTAALDEQTRPPEVDPLADDPAVEAIAESLRDAAHAIRRAVVQSRPIVVRHAATADGYVAGAAIERAVLPLVRDEHETADAEYHYFDRRPLEDRFYEMDDVTNDVTSMLENRERHGEKLPLVVLVGAGATRESADSFELLSLYGADCLVVDGGRPDAEIADLVEVMVNPFLGDSDDADGADGADLPAAVLAANLSLSVSPDVRADLAHLPAVSFWESAPATYADLAGEAGYDEAAVSDLREAISLEAYYHAYEDKRELITDLLFDPEHRDLAGHVAEQFRVKLDTELETARPHLSLREHGDVTYRVLDVESFTHRFDFPASDLLLSALHRSEREESDGTLVTLGVDEAELLIESDEPVDLRAVAERAREDVPDAGLTAKGTTDGKLKFLRGERDDVVDAVVEAITDVLDD